MTEDEALTRYGLPPEPADLPAIRAALRSQIAATADAQCADELLKLFCVQLFSAGVPSDAALIWTAKQSSFDHHCAVEVQLLCGAGLARTKTALTDAGLTEAVQYIEKCESTGGFDGFDPAASVRSYRQYYGLSAESG